MKAEDFLSDAEKPKQSEAEMIHIIRMAKNAAKAKPAT